LRYHVKAIEEAVSAHVSAALAARLRGAAAVALGEPVIGDPELTLDDVAQVLAVALCAREFKLADGETEGLTLTSAHLRTETGVAILDPIDALNHPLLAAWLRPTFAEVIAVVLRSGATLANAAPGWPLFQYCTLVESDGRAVAADVRAEFNGAQGVVHLQFGVSPDMTRLVTHKTLGGDGLFAVGCALRDSRAAYVAAVAAVDTAERAGSLH
jgi:hypothetical protein